MRNKCNLQLVNLIFRHHSVIAEVRNHLGTAAGAEADRWRAVRTGHVSQRHTAGSLELRTASGVLLVPEKKSFFFFFTPLLPSCARNSPQVLTTAEKKWWNRDRKNLMFPNNNWAKRNKSRPGFPWCRQRWTDICSFPMQWRRVPF